MFLYKYHRNINYREYIKKGDIKMSINNISGALEVLKGHLNGITNVNSTAPQSSSIMANVRGGATKKQVTKEDIENFVNEPRPAKATNLILEKSPVGLGAELSNEDLEKMGYKFVYTGYHIGAPAIYESSDGGRVRLYRGGGSPEAGEDKRKIVYEKGNLIQEMYYDDNGNLKTGKISVKDKLAGFIEKSVDIVVENGKTSFIG